MLIIEEPLQGSRPPAGRPACPQRQQSGARPNNKAMIPVNAEDSARQSTLHDFRQSTRAPTPGTGTTTTRLSTTTTRTTTTRSVASGFMPLRQDGQVTLDDLYRAYLDCRKKKRNKKGAKRFEPHALTSLADMVDEINGRYYKPKQSQCFIVKYPVPREVFCAAFRDRIVQHFIFNELNPVIERMLIRDTCSCRVGKGTDYAIERLARFVRRETDNYAHDAWCLSFDLSGFFMHINRQLLLADITDVIEHWYTGPYRDVLKYLVKIVILTDVTKGAVRLCPKKDWSLLAPGKTLFGNPNGLPIGNITSQLFANFYLNRLDHYAKSRHRSYVRYVDDGKIVDTDRKNLEQTLKTSKRILEALGQKFNDRKTVITRTRYGVLFLGVKVFPYYNGLGDKRIGRLYHGSASFSDTEDAYRSASSRRGMFIHYHGHRLSQRWYESFPEEIREVLKMDSSARFHLAGQKKEKGRLQTIRLYA